MERQAAMHRCLTFITQNQFLGCFLALITTSGQWSVSENEGLCASLPVRSFFCLNSFVCLVCSTAEDLIQCVCSWKATAWQVELIGAGHGSLLSTDLDSIILEIESWNLEFGICAGLGTVRGCQRMCEAADSFVRFSAVEASSRVRCPSPRC